MQLNETSSITINYLKCILCIGVVFIHARYYPDVTILGINPEEYKVYGAIDVYFNLQFLNCTCVPLFFVISGYLFFLNIPDIYESGVFKRKWKGRLRSLLVPYLISNGLFMLYVIVNSILHGEVIDISVLSAFWSYKGGYPLMAPTWYIRDLMVACLLAPFIWCALKYTKLLLPVLLLLCWINDFWFNIPGLGIRSFFFFTTGAFIATTGADIIEMIRPHKFWYIYLILFVSFYSLYIFSDSDTIHKIAILISFPLWISFAYLISSIANFRCINSFVTGTFFVFLYHFSVAHRIPVYLAKIFGVSEFSVVLCYIFGVFLTTLMLLFVYYVGKRIMPRLFATIVGGR